MTDSSVITVTGTEGYSLQCRQWKSEKPRALLVMLHGVVSHSGWLEEIAQGLQANNIDCLAVDRRGAGLNESMRGDAPDGTTLMKDLSAVLLWAFNSRLPCHICGFCWGANYLVNFMTNNGFSKHTQKVQTISLLAPSLFPSELITDRPFVTGQSHLADQEPNMPIEYFTDGPAYKNFILPDPLRLTHVSTRMNRIMSEFSQGIWMKFLRLTTPTLVILGADDEVVDNQATARLFERLRCDRKELCTLPGKHGLQFDAPKDVIHTISRWILEAENHQEPMRQRL